MKNPTEHIISPYMPAQIKLEEKYYDQLYGILGVLIAQLTKYIDHKQNITLEGVEQITRNFVSNYSAFLQLLNSQHSIAMIKLSNQAVNHTSNDTTLQLHPTYARKLTDNLNIKTDNLINTIKGRFIDLIPLSAFGISYILYNDETTKTDIIRRNTTSIKRMVQTTTTEGMFATIMHDAEIMGCTEYLPDNQHDDRVRETHKKYFNGVDWVKFNQPTPAGHVGEEDGCRCFIKAIR